MVESDAEAIGQRIADARGRTGLTQAELAAAIELDRSALAKVETGMRRVSALELARIADAVGERLEWFVEEAPPAVVSRRNLHDPGAASPAIDALVERLARNLEFVAKHDPHLRLRSIEPFPRPRSNTAVDDLVASARELLDVDVIEPLPDIGACVASVGLLCFSIDLGQESADGASILLDLGGVAVTNGHLQVGRRRLTTAHEFGHYLVADEFSVDWQIGAADTADQWEARLDRFARALLLPKPALQQAWGELRRAGDDLRTAAVKVASEFRVDMSTLARRLLDLHLVRPADADRVRRIRTRKADIVDFDLLVPHELVSPHLPHPYIESVLRLYRNETISAARATDLLLDTWDEADLPELHKNAIWKFVS